MTAKHVKAFGPLAEARLKVAIRAAGSQSKNLLWEVFLSMLEIAELPDGVSIRVVRLADNHVLIDYADLRVLPARGYVLFVPSQSMPNKEKVAITAQRAVFYNGEFKLAYSLDIPLSQACHHYSTFSEGNYKSLFLEVLGFSPIPLEIDVSGLEMVNRLPMGLNIKGLSLESYEVLLVAPADLMHAAEESVRLIPTMFK